jgi:hypothetical protein
MAVFNRFLGMLLGLAICAAAVGSLVLVWEQSREIDYSGNNLQFAYDIVAADQSEQILATIILGAIIAFGGALIAFELMPQRRRVVERDVDSKAYRDVEARLNDMQRRLDDQPRERVVMPEGAKVVEMRDVERPRRRWRLPVGRH